MNIKDFAKSISGKEYGYPQFTKEEIETAKERGNAYNDFMQSIFSKEAVLQLTDEKSVKALKKYCIELL